MNLCILIFTLLPLVFGDELSDCKCLEGYHAQLNEEGEAWCYGIHVKAIAPCNLRKKPRCQCGPEVTGVLNDASGTWCVKYSRGRQEKRWRCENREEWEAFFNQYPRIQHVNNHRD